MFKFKGINSKSMNVVVEEIINLIGKASQRIEAISVEGRNGEIEIPLGYNNVTSSLTMVLMKPEKLDEVLRWLNGRGELEYKGRVTQASFYTQVSPERFGNKVKIECNFNRDPFWSINGITEATDYTIENIGNECSTPLIRMEKNIHSTCEISIGAVRFKYDFKEDAYVEIDCLNKNATMSGLRKNRNLEIGFEFPKLHPGINTIKIHNGDPTLSFRYKDSFL